MVRTEDFQSSNTGSIPVPSASLVPLVYLVRTIASQVIEVGSIPTGNAKCKCFDYRAFTFGYVAEWFIALDCKSSVLRDIVGSNPTGPTKLVIYVPLV